MELKNRILSLIWRASMMGVVVFLDIVVQGATQLSLPVWSVIAIGLVAGEISKYLNKKYGLKSNEEV